MEESVDLHEEAGKVQASLRSVCTGDLGQYSPTQTYRSVYKTIEFMFAGINMFWARLRFILARAVRRGLK